MTSAGVSFGNTFPARSVATNLSRAMTAPPATLYAIQIHFPLPHLAKARVPPGIDVVPS